MFVSRKCQYALRAVFELVKRQGEGPIRIRDIAEAQAIPVRFLEVILPQLRAAGLVESQRGREGGYYLQRKPEEVTVGEVIYLVEGPVTPVGCDARPGKEGECPFVGECAFLPLWEQVRAAIESVYDHTTFQDLVESEQRVRGAYVPGYAI